MNRGIGDFYSEVELYARGGGLICCRCKVDFHMYSIVKSGFLHPQFPGYRFLICAGW